MFGTKLKGLNQECVTINEFEWISDYYIEPACILFPAEWLLLAVGTTTVTVVL